MSDEPILGDGEPRRMRRIPEIETAIGGRLRALRVAAGLTQSALGEATGLSFQQIQKYETGKDRIAVSTLQRIATALEIHPGSFFDSEMPSPIGDIPDIRAALKGVERLQRISNPTVRKQLIALIDALAYKTEP